MKKFISAALVVAMTAASCVNKDDLGNDKTPQQPSVDGTMIFSAQFAGPDQPSSVAAKVSPTYVENDKDSYVEVRWDQYDKVGVYAQDGAPSEFVAQSGGEESTTLKGSIQEAETYYAMYPYDAEAVIENGVISTALPAAQIATKDAFAAHLAVSSTNSNSFTFQNVCGLVRVNIGCEHVTSIEFKGNDEETVAGDIDITASTAEYANGTTQEKVITVTPPTGSETFEVGAYYFSVLPQTFEKGFTVTYNTADDVKELRQAGKVIIPRSKLVVGKAFTDITGAGTENDPYIIKTAHDLCSLSAKLATDEKNECHVELANDIDMSSVTEWTPICNTRDEAAIPEMHFDGKGYSIKNFKPTTVTVSGGSQVSLFGFVYGSVRNLKMTDVDLTTTENTSAPLAAFVGLAGKNLTVIEDVEVSGKISGAKVVGGVVATAENASFIDCVSTVAVTATDAESAGFIGRLTSGLTFTNCYATGEINGDRAAGGFAGGSNTTTNSALYDGTIEFTNCYSTGDVTGTYQMGGFIGHLRTENVAITNCYSTGDVTTIGTNAKGTKQIGGLIGVNSGAKLTVKYSYYDGTISKARSEVGGILGLDASGSATIEKSFALVTMSDYDATNKGGLVGHTKSDGLTMTGCYAAGTYTGSTEFGRFVGLVANDSSKLDGCIFGGTGPTTDIGSGDPSISNCSVLAEADKAAYSTASKVASKLGWDTTVWDLTGDTPKLNCFKK